MPMSTRRRLLALLIVACAALALPRHVRLDTVEAQSGTAIRVDVAAHRHPIDPRVYGVNWATASQLAALNVPVHRWGGNSTTRHNWKTNGDNRGSDWYFESIPGTGAPGAAFDDFVQLSKQNGSEPMATIPLIGWVGKNGPGGTKLASFSAAKYGAQQDCDWSWYPDACNGVLSNGARVTGNDPADANVASSAQYQKEWVQHLVARWGLAAAGGVRYYLYDNEPSLWHATHRDVHPAGQTMTELRDLMIAYGTAIREADPGAVLLGPEEWGWSGYFFSGYDQKYGSETGCWSCAPDKAAHGGTDYVPWLLGQMRLHEQSTGKRLLDVFTLHYYPQGGEFGGDTSVSMQALRNRSTRSLWDPGYTDESWIGEEVRLIPRMKEWVSASYPGLETGITEYSWGADEHINGATAQADVLGIFGREGLDVGTRWVVPATGTPTFKAIQMYRNYDGARSTFGDVSVEATAPDPDELAAFAAERSSDGAVTVMAINKSASAALVSLSLASFTAGAAAQVWQLTSANSIRRLADASVAAGAIGATLPAQSITLYVVPRSASLTPSLSIGDATVNEGQAGSTSATFTVALSAASSQAVTVSYATSNGTATAGSDYAAASGVLTFAAGQTSRTIAVPVSGDTAAEPDETFFVNLSAPAGATIADGQGQGTIANDDASPPPGEPVSWVNVIGASTTAGSLTKTAASGWGNAGAASSRALSGDGYAEFTLPASPGYAMFGLGNGDSDQGFADVDFAFYTHPGTGRLLVYEKGTSRGSFGAYAAGDTLRVVLASSVVRYYRNGALLYSSLQAPALPLRVDTALYSQGATVSGATLAGALTSVALPREGVVWRNAVGVSYASAALTKTAPGGWGNAGASSTRAIPLGSSGYAEFTVPASPGYAVFGLSSDDADRGYADVDYAFYTHPASGQVAVLESGVYRVLLGAYAPGDKLHVSVDSGAVRYWFKGRLAYTSSRRPASPLRVDAALYSTGAAIQGATLAGALVSVP
jgi:hypothetical protein